MTPIEVGFFPLSQCYCKGFPILSLYVLECDFHVEDKWVADNVRMTRGQFWERNKIIFASELRALYNSIKYLNFLFQLTYQY